MGTAISVGPIESLQNEVSQIDPASGIVAPKTKDIIRMSLILSMFSSILHELTDFPMGCGTGLSVTTDHTVPMIT
jgi:hypothetical protein